MKKNTETLASWGNIRGKWHYLAVKKISALLRVITSKHHGDCNRKKLESHKKVCGNKDFCNAIMLSEDTKILEINQCQKSDKVPFIIYEDLERIIEKIDGCKKNPEISFTTKE